MQFSPTAKMDGKRRNIFNGKDLKTHWFITVVETKEDSPNKDVMQKSCRCWGYEESFDKAEEAVINNYMDLHECSYQWAIVEEHVMSYFALPTGLFQWYHWNEDEKKYERCSVPEWARGICAWGVG